MSYKVNHLGALLSALSFGIQKKIVFEKWNLQMEKKGQSFSLWNNMPNKNIKRCMVQLNT